MTETSGSSGSVLVCLGSVFGLGFFCPPLLKILVYHFYKKCRTRWVKIMLRIEGLNTTFPIVCIIIEIISKIILVPILTQLFAIWAALTGIHGESRTSVTGRGDNGGDVQQVSLTSKVFFLQRGYNWIYFKIIPLNVIFFL